MARKHYHVFVGLRGCYMPNSNDPCRTKREAQASARWHADNARDAGDKVRGSARSGYYTVGDYESIEVCDCDEPDCLCGTCGGTGEIPIPEGSPHPRGGVYTYATSAPCGDCGGDGFPLL